MKNIFLFAHSSVKNELYVTYRQENYQVNIKRLYYLKLVVHNG